MDKNFKSVIYSLVGILAIMLILVLVLGNMLGIARFQTDQATLGMRLGFMFVGLLAVYVVYSFTKTNPASFGDFYEDVHKHWFKQFNWLH